ncbi:putative secreted protein [Wickerhamomyces ciferrii]|uniref:Secreted protein n=1 Tax=Wickerhamomyces ciferrii (strain ATCC 14091 / BCRC 22168 / CBS 111 / JCM 3599 / NBRC 0793 / NRRL Y-1031 F-60-10) TaxID=1206466 RepID=K0KCE3_WICCF|nr:uncharacterized protein BN7_2289 [Wickerhamomyces ciferrii]CCH42745.1 putative secreted protein [Wickerhamomyces ciferrii]
MKISLKYLAFFIQAALASSSYIVQIKSESTFEDYLQQSITQLLGIKPSNDSSKIEIGDFKAFVADFEESLLDKLKGDASVHNVYPNAEISIFDSQPSNSNLQKRYRQVLEPESESTKSKSSFSKRDGVTTQSNAPRHLARISSREGIYNKQEPFEYKYKETGDGITVYVLDSGVATLNSEFEGRAKFGYNAVFGELNGDYNGHGTNVAGLVGSKTYGVAKDASIIDVKVLNGQGRGSTEGILKGIEWANNNRKKNNIKGIANLSLGGGYVDALNEAVNAAYKDGLPVVVASGNSNIDTKNTSPGSAENVITVGALDDHTDTIAIYSNWGPDVDIFAPGAYVESASNNIFASSGGQWFGTSESSPIVAGVAAQLLESGVTVGNLKDELIKLSTKNAISQQTYDNNKDYANTVNRNLYNGVEDTADKIDNPSTEQQDDSLRQYIE